jgi:large subunit ribosomal protein L6
MSRIGRLPIAVVPGVTINVSDDKIVTVKGPLGQLEQKIDSKNIEVKIDAGRLTVERTSETHDTKSKHGLYRALIANMVTGVTKGFSKKLIVNGVGYKCNITGKKLVMNIGYSHPVEIEPPEGITVACNTPVEIEVKGISKEVVGACAAKIRASRPVEPYHAYGIRYSDETVTRKEGKTAGK